MRLEKLRAKLVELELDGCLIVQPNNRYYLSGFTGSNGVLLITKEKQIIATDSRYYKQVAEECPTWELVKVGHDFPGQMLEIIRQAGLGGRSVAIESHVITIATLHKWERAVQGQVIFQHTFGLIEQMRMQKSPEELVALRKAIALADETYHHIAQWIKPGLTEIAVAWEIENYMRTHGATAISFEPIVASGPNGAKPHADPSDRVIQAGDPITLDFGCVVDNYCSDLTRTICLGEPADDKYLEVWHIVREAEEKAINQAKAGMTGEAVDRIARDHIAAAGYKEYFEHGLGHGVGLAIHEGPRFSFTYPHEIPVGAVVTVEPGIYIPEWSGVRLEDIVVVHDDHVERLSQAPKEPIIAL